MIPTVALSNDYDHVISSDGQGLASLEMQYFHAILQPEGKILPLVDDHSVIITYCILQAL